MASPSEIRALVVTLDPWLGKTFDDLSREFGILAQASSSRGALEELSREKFEALLMDFDTVADTAPILATLRGVPSNKAAVVLAVATGSERKMRAFSAGANFVLERPLEINEVRRTLGAAYGLMQGERRRYFRCAAALPVRFMTNSGRTIECSTMNISSSGMAIATPTPLTVAETLEVIVSLPDGNSIHATGVVVWDDKHGRTGLHFQCAIPEMRQMLDSWLDARFAAERGGGRSV